MSETEGVSVRNGMIRRKVRASGWLLRIWCTKNGEHEWLCEYWLLREYYSI